MNSLRTFLLSLPLLFLSLVTLAQPSDIQAYYPFSGNANDVTGSNNGTLGTGSLAPNLLSTGLGDLYNAYQFDGSDDRIELPAAVLNGHGEFTIGLYLRYNQFSGQAARFRSILSKTGQFELLAKNSEIQFNTYDNTGSELVSLTYDHLSDGNSIDDGVWHHVAVVQTTTDIKIYIDGVEEATTTYTGTYKSSTVNPIVLGEPQDGNYVYFPGDIDELYFYPRDLTAIEIQDLSIVRNFPTQICYEEGVVTFGGAFPEGGVYSGSGVTNADDGINFDFDPSYGTATINYTLSSPARVATNTIYVNGDRWAADADGDGFPSASEFMFACVQPIGYIEPAGLLSPDCDDNDADEKPNQNWYADEDGDGYGDSNASPIVQCEIPTGPAGAYVINNSDCDDNDSGINPTTVWYIGVDADNDGFFGSTSSLTQCAQPAGYSLQAPDTPDCDDSDSDELPNQNWYADEDSDGYGDVNAIAIVQCEIPTSPASAYVLNNADCDDNDANEFPGQSWYADEDGDGYGDSNTAVIQCEIPTSPASAYVTDNTDCDDEDSGINPATVWYMGVDADNDGFFGSTSSLTQCAQPAGYSLLAPDTPDCDDNDDTLNPNTIWYADTDKDGFGNSEETTQSCLQPSGYVAYSYDCNDDDDSINPNTSWYPDSDGDGYGDENGIAIEQCELPTGPASAYVHDNTDCNDSDPLVYPDANDIMNGIDDNCNGYIDDDNSFLTFEMPEQISSSIDYENHKVTVLFPGNYSGLDQTMTYTISPGATISPESGYSDVQFGHAISFDITSPDQRVQSWDVVLKKGLNDESDITSFTFPNQIGEAVIDSENRTVVASIYDTESLVFSPTIELSYGASGNPISLESVDFTNSVSTPVVYTITSQNGAVTQDWSVTINELSLTSYFYPFNGNFEDVSGNGKHGTSSNPPTLTTDRTSTAQGAYSFDGNNDLIELPSDVLNGAQGTIAVWVKYTDMSGGGAAANRVVVAKAGSTDSQFALLSGNKDFKFEMYADGPGNYLEVNYDFDDAGENFSDDSWHHLVVTFSQAEAVLFVDGLPKASSDQTSGVFTDNSTNPLTIGGLSTSQYDNFAGTIDDVRLYNNVLSPEMIANLSEKSTDIVGVSFTPQIGIPIIDKENHTVTLEAPFGTDITSLSPIISVSEGASITTAEANPQDFTSDVTYTVTAADAATTQDWVFSMTIAPNTATDILTFTSGGGTGVIDLENHTVVLDAAANSLSLANLIADFTLSPGATATIDEESKNSGDELLEYTDPFIMTITAEDESTRQDWMVTVNIPPSITFTASAVSLGSDFIIHGNNFSTTEENIVTFGAITANVISVAHDFLRVEVPIITPGYYAMKVTTRNLETNTYPIIIARNPADVLSLSLPEATNTSLNYNGDYSWDGYISVPYGTDITALSPSIQISEGATISPASGEEVDFTNPVTYTVTGSYGVTTSELVVSVSIDPNTATDIASFSIPGQSSSSIDTDNYTIALEMPFGTDLTSLVADFGVSYGATANVGMTDQVSGTTVNDFTSPVTYTITAEDGETTQDWTVTVTISPNTATDITSFSIPGQVAASSIDPDNHTIEVEMPFGTNLTSLDASFELSVGASVKVGSVSQTSGVTSNDFSVPVTYTVTAEDGQTSQDWVVTVTIHVNTWVGATWSLGNPPAAVEDAIISSNYIASEHGDLTANNLTIGENATLVIDGGSTLDVKGNLVNNGTVRIASGSSLITYSGNIISNNIIIERNTRYAGGKYSFVGSPVRLDENITASNLGPIVYAYDESKPYSDNEGLDRWIWQNANVILKPAQGYAQANQKEVAFTGKPNDGTVTVAGTYTGTPNDGTNDATEGWNLVSNPYPAAIFIDDFLDANTNTTGSVYIWDDNGSESGRGSNTDYIVANKSGATDNNGPDNKTRWNNHIGSAQGFFVKLDDGPGDITFTETMRRTGFNADDNFFRKAEKPIIRLNLTHADGLQRQALVSWNEAVSNDVLTKGYDAKVFNPSADYLIYTQKTDAPLAIQTVNSQMVEIPVGMRVAEAGEYSIVFELEHLAGRALYLLDKQTGERVLANDGGYTFILEQGETADRFVLTTSSGVLALDNLKTNIYTASKVLYIETGVLEPTVYQVYNLAGVRMKTILVNRSAMVNLDELANGVYVITDGQHTQKVILK
ncbi:MAG: hypothetical protein JXR10_09955 [Cyclobacteriaceae bacterium]